MSDQNRHEDDWPLFRRPKRPAAPRIDRKHDPVYREIRAELEQREADRRKRETAPAASTRPELPAIAAAEPAELAELTTVCTT